MISKKILDFYKKTSLYTDLGLYKDFALSLPDDIKTLCLLERKQTIHPFDLKDEEEMNNKDSFHGDMTKVPKTSLLYENDLFPTSIGMLSELLRRDPVFSVDRKIEDKIHICCREMSILLAAILKAKGIPARCRSGFSKYVSEIGGAGDHWILEYYDKIDKRWILVDPTMCYDKETLDYFEIDFNLYDIPRNNFIFGAEAYLNIRKKIFNDKDIFCFSDPIIYGIKAAIRGLFYDFHSLMNDEIPFLYQPKYARDKDFDLTEDELKELDELALLMLDPESNFNKLKEIWDKNLKFRILSGGMNS